MLRRLPTTVRAAIARRAAVTRAAIARHAENLFALTCLASLLVGLAMIWVPLGFIAFGVGGLVYLVRNTPPEPVIDG